MPDLKACLKLRAFWELIRGCRCQICGLVQDSVRDHSVLCPGCAGLLRMRSGGFCPDCARIYALEDTFAYTCLECRIRPFSWDEMGFFGAYQGLLKDLILEFKFKGDLGLGKVLGDLLAKACRMHGLTGNDILVPVPAHEKKLRERGFNQSLELARILGRSLNVPVRKQALIKQVYTPAQSTLARKERLKALKGVFLARADQVESCSVLLIDDIFTTGSTLEECTRTLLKAGASKVQILFLARSI